jgi:hypothetical protein
MAKLELRLWEKLLLVLAGTTSALSALAFLTEFPLSRYVLGLSDEGGQRPVGKVDFLKGSVKRQLSGDAEFKSVSTGETVFNDDTFVTGADGTTRLAIEGNGQIELSPSAMVKVSFASGFSLDGILRKPIVEVVSGQVKASSPESKVVIKPAPIIAAQTTVSRPKPSTRPSDTPPPIRLARPLPSVLPSPVIEVKPSPKPLWSAAPVVLASPSPIPVKPSPSPSPSPSTTATTPPVSAIEITTPSIQSPLQIKPVGPVKMGQPLNYPLELSWKTKPAPAKLKVTVERLENGQTTGAPVFSGVVTPKGKQSSVSINLARPGRYRITYQTPEGTPLPRSVKAAKTEIVLNPEVAAIEALPPFVGGELLTSNQVLSRQLKNFDITLRWKAIEGVQKYRIWLANSANATQPLLVRVTEKPEFIFNKDKVFSGKLFYKISADLGQGYQAISGLQSFNFDFLAPRPTNPKDGAQVNQQTIQGEQGNILLTWQKTSFTEKYELQISLTKDFSKPLLQNDTQENFYVFRFPNPGVYYWRVRGFAAGVKSPYSAIQKLEIIP